MISHQTIKQDGVLARLLAATVTGECHVGRWGAGEGGGGWMFESR